MSRRPLICSRRATAGQVFYPPQLNENGQIVDSDVAIAEAATKKKAQPVVRHGQKVGRNDPCPCGSGRKYKHCHGKLS